MSASLMAWKEHSLGANGGYVDPENMTYIVARHVNGSSDVIEVTGKTSFIDDTFSHSICGSGLRILYGLEKLMV